MTFSRYNPSGYTDGQTLPAACVNQLDLNLSRAIDGYAGGSWSPSTAITIAGAGVVLTFSGSSNYPILSSRNLTRATRGQWVAETGFDDWSASPYFDGSWSTNSVGAGGQILTCRERFEAGATPLSVTFYTNHAAHGASWPPGTRTSYDIAYRDLNSGGVTHLVTQTDDTSQAIYESHHAYTILVPAHTWVATDVALLSVITEFGANALAGTIVYGATVTQTFTELRPI